MGHQDLPHGIREPPPATFATLHNGHATTLRRRRRSPYLKPRPPQPRRQPPHPRIPQHLVYAQREPFHSTPPSRTPTHCQKARRLDNDQGQKSRF